MADDVPHDTTSTRSVTLVTDEVLGAPRCGGLGTATSYLAIALARRGHRVEILHATEPPVGIAAPWAELYASSGVVVRRPEPGSTTRVEPPCLRTPLAVARALEARPADVVVAPDWAGPTALAERRRDLGLSSPRTAFVVVCHGPSRWVEEAEQRTPKWAAKVELGLLEREAVERADRVVAPSAYMLGWLRARGWSLHEPEVIPNPIRSAVLGGPSRSTASAAPARRIAFFGRLETRKGVGLHLEALATLPPRALGGAELLFLGAETPLWPREEILRRLGELPARPGAIRVETGLDHDAALAELLAPGTVAVIPSLVDNSPSTVHECVERGIPFVATSTGGIPEIVAADDRARVLVDPTAASLGAALERALTEGIAAAGAAHDPGAAIDAWEALVRSATPRARQGPSSPPPAAPERVTKVDLDDLRVAAPGSPGTAGGEWLLVSDRADHPLPELVDRLCRAQAASGADAVTCGTVSDAGAVTLFHGDPGGLGALRNAYGTVALARRSALTPSDDPVGDVRDPLWPLLARLALDGGSIVSIPEPLVRTARAPGDVASDPSAANAVLRAFGARLPAAASLLADLAQLPASAASATTRPSARRLAGRLRRRLARRGP